MRKVTPEFMRIRIVELCKEGKTAKQVSELLNLGYGVVAKIWRNYRKEGDSALKVGYSRCGRKSSYDAKIREAIDAHLSENKALGAPIIRSRLLQDGNFDKVPHERTIQRWWIKTGKNKPRGRRPKQKGDGYTNEVHHTWQVDAKDKVRIADKSEHSYLSFTDEASCSYLSGQVFPPEATEQTGKTEGGEIGS